jgi:hypothetical protein
MPDFRNLHESDPNPLETHRAANRIMEAAIKAERIDGRPKISVLDLEAIGRDLSIPAQELGALAYLAQNEVNRQDTALDIGLTRMQIGETDV